MSTMVPMYGFGGGSGGLNFTVVGGTTAPSNPKENMIWVNTSTAITDWVFSATQPTAASGRVWIFTGTSSTFEFNALKKNGIQVYPISAKQYVSGAWVNVAAMSYQNGEWVNWWDGTMYASGDEFKHITGGWSGINLTKGTTELSVSAKETTDYRGSAWTNNFVDLSGYKTINFTCSAELDEYKACAVLITTNQTANDSAEGMIAKWTTPTTTIANKTYSLEIPSGLPNSGYWVKLFAWNTTFKVSKIWLER